MTFTPRFAELFAGAGGFGMGFERAGFENVWHAEIAPDPRCVLEQRWPNVPLYGDVTALDGAALRAAHGDIDILIGGSPCQDLSVAGKRAGLEGARSSLFFHQMRLWEETGADLCLWENVDGARSSNSGKDFGAVLGAFVGAAVPVPADGWRGAGVAAGPRGVAAWRVLDAQYFGVPQRRRRVFVLGTRTGRIDPAEVLSLSEGVRGDSPPSREAREGIADDARASVASSLLAGGRETGPHGSLDGENLVLAFDWKKGNDKNSPRPSTMNVTENVTGTLGATREPAILAFHSVNDGSDSGAERRTALRAHDPMAVVAFHMKGDGGDYRSELSETVRSGEESYGGTPPAVLAFDLAQITHPENRATVRAGAPAPSLNQKGQVHVAHALTHEGSDASEDGTGRGTPIIVAPLDARTTAGGFPGTDGAIGGHVIANTVMAREAKGWNPASAVGNGTVSHGIPRRLTPCECERLMGWPDDHTLVTNARGKPMSDASRYRMCGNGVASPVAHWIAWRLWLALSTTLRGA